MPNILGNVYPNILPNKAKCLLFSSYPTFVSCLTDGEERCTSFQCHKKKIKMTDEIQEQLNRIERYSLLSAKNMFGLEEASLFLNMSKSFLYKLTYRHEIPYYRPNGKQIYFDRKELEDWMRRNRVATIEEIEQSATNYLVTGKIGG